MKCTNCGAELVPEARFCGECGAPRPQRSRRVPPPFAEAERRFAMLCAGYQAGELDEAVYNAELQKPIVVDGSGGYWRLGADDGKWYWRDGQQWVRRDPPSATVAVEHPQARPAPPPAVAPITPAVPPTKKEFPWKWVAAGFGGLLVVAAVVGVVWAVSQGSTPPEPTLAVYVTPTTALQPAQDIAPTATPFPTVMPTVEPTATPCPEPVEGPPPDTPTPVSPTETPLPTATPKLPTAYTDKLDSTPDLMQTDPDADLPGGGTQYCAPVSVSNSLMWLVDHGFSNLVPDSTDRKEAQATVARLLGSDRYMDTNLESGTGPFGVLRGLSRYIKDQGYPYQSLEYQGWREHPARFSTGTDVPELEWLKEGLRGHSGVWLNIGWYQYDSSTDQYERIGGHWVTLVGYGVDKNGHEAPDVFIVHDPGSESGPDLSHDYVHAKLINRGQLTGEMSGLPRSAVGYYVLAGDLHVREDADYGILDGAVLLKMGEPTATSGPLPPVEPTPPHIVLLYSDERIG